MESSARSSLNPRWLFFHTAGVAQFEEPLLRRHSRLLLLPKHLPVRFAIGIETIMFTVLPGGFQFGLSNVPVRTAFLQHNAQVLPKLFDGRPTKKPVAVVD